MTEGCKNNSFVCSFMYLQHGRLRKVWITSPYYSSFDVVIKKQVWMWTGKREAVPSQQREGKQEDNHCASLLFPPTLQATMQSLQVQECCFHSWSHVRRVRLEEINSSTGKSKPCPKVPHVLHMFETSRGGDFTTSLGSLFQYLITFLVRKSFVISILNLLQHTMRPFPLGLLLGNKTPYCQCL